MGSATQQVHTFVTRMFKNHSWLTWRGKFCSDPLGILGAAFACSCKSDEEARQTWKQFEDSKYATDSLKGAPNFPAFHPLPSSVLPSTPPELHRHIPGQIGVVLASMRSPPQPPCPVKPPATLPQTPMDSTSALPPETQIDSTQGSQQV